VLIFFARRRSRVVNSSVVFAELSLLHWNILFITRHSLVRAKGEVFVLLYVFFVRSTISRQPAGRFTPKFACGRSLVPDVSSPLLGLEGPGGRKKGKRNFGYYGSQWGIFAFCRFLSDISTTRGRIHAKFYTCRDNVFRRAPSPLWTIGPWGRGEGKLKTQKNGGQLPFLFFSTLPNVVQYVGHRPAHILV